MIIILDTSVILSTLLSRRPNHGQKIIRLAIEKKLTFATCKEAFIDLRKALDSNYLKILPSYYPQKLARFIAWYKYNSLFYTLKNTPFRANTILRDETDMFWLHLVDESKAKVLITLDKDLLILKTYNNSSVLSPVEFLTFFNSI